MKATSQRSRPSAATVSPPTVACVMPRTRPPSRCTWVPALPAASCAATGTELVTTVPSVPGGTAAASRATEVPESNSTVDPGWGRYFSAAWAMRVFCATKVGSRSVSAVSTRATFSATTAPPCTRRRMPRLSRASRSRRMVSVVTSNRVARSATDTRSYRSARFTIVRCRSSAYILDPFRATSMLICIVLSCFAWDCNPYATSDCGICWESCLCVACRPGQRDSPDAHAARPGGGNQWHGPVGDGSSRSGGGPGSRRATRRRWSCRRTGRRRSRRS